MSAEGSLPSAQKRGDNRLIAVWGKYRAELMGPLAIALGLFLVLEFVAKISRSYLIGALLIVGAGITVLLRIRWRLLKDPEFTKRGCPVCGGSTHRIHRTRLDRLISVVVPVRRHSCRDATCGWRGLRVGKSHETSQHRATSLR